MSLTFVHMLGGLERKMEVLFQIPMKCLIAHFWCQY